MEVHLKHMRMYTLKALITTFILSIAGISFAGEGMWLPLLLKALNEEEMQAMGMKITAEDIYSINRGSLKDAIAHFGGFCTSEVISDQGLLLTNHHCGYRQIQSHSTVENNLLKNGYWAKDQSEELANPGLFAMFIDRIDDVTEKALAGVTDEMDSRERQSTIDKNLEMIKTEYTLGQFQDLKIRPFYHGNQYFAFTTTSYPDVRLVGTPPEAIGKFGADTDNWEWPRHTGDFAIFRIYAGPNNEPAEYSPENKPYNPKHHLPISLDGVEEGDFTMVFGFPGRTNQYLPSIAVEQIVNKLNPAKIAIRDKALKIVDAYMREDEKTRIQYASKFASIANYWKKWIGESQGLEKTNAIAKKKKFEKEFIEKNEGNEKYLNLLPQFEELYKKNQDFAFTRDYFNEVAGRNVELLSIAGIFGRLIDRYENNGEEEYNAYLQRVVAYLSGFYKNYRSDIDKEVFQALVEMYATNVNQKFVPGELTMRANPNGYSSLADKLYDNSSFTSEEKTMAVLNLPAEEAIAKIKEDPVYKLSSSWSSMIDEKVNAEFNANKEQIDELQRTYMKAIMETFPKKRFYPDANSTMRVTYGQVAGYKPKDGVCYTPVTYLDGVIEKYVPGDYEFDVPEELIKLYDAGDFGQYADTNGKVPICFLGSNHTSGGNSGSPAIDAHGNLIGLNFDRVWEGTMSDINYDKSICRNIMVDARYILFIVDKMAGATHLVDEMTLVHPKRPMKK